MTGGKQKKPKSPQEEFDDDLGVHLDGQGTNYHDLDDDHDELVGEDRDGGPDHPIRRPPGHKHHSDPSTD